MMIAERGQGKPGRAATPPSPAAAIRRRSPARYAFPKAEAMGEAPQAARFARAREAISIGVFVCKRSTANGGLGSGSNLERRRMERPAAAKSAGKPRRGRGAARRRRQPVTGKSAAEARRERAGDEAAATPTRFLLASARFSGIVRRLCRSRFRDPSLTANFCSTRRRAVADSRRGARRLELWASRPARAASRCERPRP